jgi:hypothetical protein
MTSTPVVANPYDMQTQAVSDLLATRSMAAAADLDMMEAFGL